MKIALIPGDGIGPDIIEEAVKVIHAIGEKKQIPLEFNTYLVGGSAIDHTGTPLPEDTLKGCKESDAVLLGAVGGPKWDTLPGHLRPERGLLGLRKEMTLFANLRPAILFPQLKSASTLKEEIIGAGIDIMVVRELTGGIYFGERGRVEETRSAYDIETYSEDEIERIVRIGFEIAKKRKKKLTSIDKANVLETSRLWREVAERVAKEYPEIELQHMYVDNCAMQLIRNPHQFDVMVTSNMFGDILSDEASMLTGSLGMLPSASLSSGKLGMYEPIHGSAPDIAGQDIANPIATILSAAMMFRYSFEMEAEAVMIEQAVANVLEDGYRTKDIMEKDMKLVGTKEMGNLIAEQIKKM
ncbi:3-isopropylmalate dehydrogenase [Geosporobacter ferrireducens]|uniref:3-isopropylmalate dehydrogenase n=1 Tax=Geosporobacter ferrireducens TaxID=1424294 RepID=UPI00139DE737|nr:3-isopropylmalate dehydrogenase [Geosporobacter ferrireducens]MTI53588.1 3-isopropylmalate dehydrogenase [Geosporobacter ferrireducens]